MILTRRQVIALLLGAAAAPAIAEPAAEAIDVRSAEALDIRVGDVFTIQGIDGSWTVKAIFEAMTEIVYSIEHDGVFRRWPEDDLEVTWKPRG